MKASQELVDLIGSPISNDLAMGIIKKFLESFRKPVVKNRPETHGPIWSQFLGVVKWSDTQTVEELPSSNLFLLWDERKSKLLFEIGKTDFVFYLNSRKGRSYPPIYLFDDGFNFCVCQNGDDCLIRPVRLMFVESMNQRGQG